MICKYCNVEIEDSCTICANCGCPVENSSKMNVAKNKKMAIVGAVVFALFIAFTVIVFVNKSSREPLVGTWEARLITMDGEYIPGAEKFTAIVSKDGNIHLYSPGYNFDVNLYWQYDEVGTSYIRDEDPTVRFYDLYISEEYTDFAVGSCVLSTANDAFNLTLHEFGMLFTRVK